MIHELSSNTQAILLLTAPLIAGRQKPSASPLTNSEYRRLAHRLRELRREPADLLKSGAREILKECPNSLETERLDRLLGRGFLLSQAVERWRTRAIWVVSRADSAYPRRLKKHLGEGAPPILYGCGEASILDTGGLAVVGSRHVSEALISYTENVGRLVAAAQRTLVSGGARGIDQAAMRGALEAGGRATGVLGDSLEKSVTRREYRDALMTGRLMLMCPYDPAAGFQVGHAMQRNKLIYALADAALVVNSDYRKGGTWTGAVEQLDNLKLVPIYVRSDGDRGKGLDALQERGALSWPNPRDPESLDDCLNVRSISEPGDQGRGTISTGERDGSVPLEEEPHESKDREKATSATVEPSESTPADEQFAQVRALLQGSPETRTEAEIAEILRVSKKQAGIWLMQFVELELRELFEHSDAPKTEAEVSEALRVSSGKVRGTLKRLLEEKSIERIPRKRPFQYRRAGAMGPLFDRAN